MRLGFSAIGLCLSVTLFATSVGAADKDQKKPARADVLQKLIDCRAIPSDAERLACYETQTAKIDDADDMGPQILALKSRYCTKGTQVSLGQQSGRSAGGLSLRS